MPISPTDLAWAAGFYDGEGCTKLSRQVHTSGKNVNNESTSVHIEINQVDRFVLDRFASIVGVGKVNGPYNKRGINQRPQFSYRCGAILEVQHVINLLMPYLSPIKIEQAELKLAEYNQDHESKITRWCKEVTV